MKVYLCGPINGCTDEECMDWREEAKRHLPDTLDPMRRDYRGKEQTAYREIVEGDIADIDESDVLLVNYDRPSVGTSMEIFYAHGKGKHIVVVHSKGAVLSPWLLYHTDYFFTSFETALNFLTKHALSQRSLA